MEVNEEIIRELFNLANTKMPDDCSEVDLLNMVVKLKSGTISYDEPQEIIPEEMFNCTNSILVVDDIGVVTYQLKILLSNAGYNVKVAKDIFVGLNIFAKSKFDFIIMDLFVTTEQEGFMLLHEAKKIITEKKLPTKIIVITASNKAEYKIKCLNGGANYFIKKDIGWQDKLVEIVCNADNENIKM